MPSPRCTRGPFGQEVRFRPLPTKNRAAVQWRNGNAEVCKTAMSRLDTGLHLQHVRSSCPGRSGDMASGCGPEQRGSIPRGSPSSQGCSLAAKASVPKTVIAGSSPATLATFKTAVNGLSFAPIVQLAETAVSEAACWVFESPSVHQQKAAHSRLHAKMPA